ncbi:hypothetical protein [Desulforamulus aquiferis]|uniref:Rod shape-determining protein MreD n=1 Tax=Desulforamulus aquiferis TaxID=1397668 RepID=A0AAW7ZG62_9FIRM|nr:hypothetical protein [Desulforamulus aquiferis]MDO7788687.1 hypothetical protein [Desulforamulus aquiferis]
MGTAFINYVFQGIPEMAALIFTAFSLVGHRTTRWKVLWFGVFLASLTWLLRLCAVIPFGLHTLVAAFTLAIIIYREVKISLGKSFFISFFTFFLLMILETGFHYIMENILGITFSNQGWTWVMAGWPQVLGLLALSIILRKYIPPRLFNS